ncbi:glycolate oxidase subunit GlcE [Caenimonas aquaedulcis]|uniref:Glycolate oxidase subunit GlcE n=1 Tax=Caenimonas aquaedulcis TaxID=2793270 RepID=A0A931H5S2_9BURK|nr:glycolate oxidase subunit GlcE [Caenimonas aquaedulcis]MBG9389144.1 glycolate oxidase subunit GlcE [Caenimonas aquaedulcis]
MEPSPRLFIERIRAAAAGGSPLRIRGGGSKDFYGQPSAGEWLDTREFAGVVSYEPSELVVTARAGTPLAELEALLAGSGQCLPFEPPHFGGGATVGGMVAAGLSGPARASAGPVRDYVLGLTMINGRGEALTFGGQVMKNVAGYDVSRLMVGALGTLGLITEVSLKVLPVPVAEATLEFEVTQAEALRRLNAWGGQPLPLNASCWVEDAGVGTLYLRLRGAAAAVESACRTMGGERADNATVAPDWTLCRDQRLPWFEERGERDLWRLSVPQTAPALDLPEPPLIEWHGGERWVRAGASDAQRLRDAAAAAGGHATLFRAGSSPAGTPRFAALPSPLDRIHRELKRQFDPAGIFNPGRLIPES